jgi:hypothetical protein
MSRRLPGVLVAVIAALLISPVPASANHRCHLLVALGPGVAPQVPLPDRRPVEARVGDKVTLTLSQFYSGPVRLEWALNGRLVQGKGQVVHLPPGEGGPNAPADDFSISVPIDGADVGTVTIRAHQEPMCGDDPRGDATIIVMAPPAPAPIDRDSGLRPESLIVAVGAVLIGLAALVGTLVSLRRREARQQGSPRD